MYLPGNETPPPTHSPSHSQVTALAVLSRTLFFNKYHYCLCPLPPHVLVDFVVLPLGHGSSVTDFWGWDAHEAQLCCADNVSGDIGGCSARRALKPKFYQPTKTMVTAGILPFRENSHGRAGNRTRDLMISSQRLWPLDHEVGHTEICASWSWTKISDIHSHSSKSTPW